MGGILAANTRAEQIYGPVVERRQRVDKVRSTLYILQRYRFLFNLPSSLLESIKQVNSSKRFILLGDFN